MPGVAYRGFAAMFADKRFARKMFAFNLGWLCLLSLYVIWSNGGSEVSKISTCETRSIAWDEFLQHSCETEDLWILVNGKVYDMWPWGVNQHPGGRMICQGARVDSTEIFNTIHPDYVNEFMNQFCIGKIVDQPLTA